VPWTFRRELGDNPEGKPHQDRDRSGQA